MDLRENGRAILAMMVAMAAFIVNDTLIKLASERLPLGEIIFVRSAIAGTVILAACLVTGTIRQLHHLKNRTVVIRTVAEIVSMLLYLVALFRMPIANATAILQALPLAVTAGAALFFNVPVGWRRWSAIIVGFIGVLMIVRPGLEGFDVWALVALASVLTVAVRDLVTRSMPATVPTLGVVLLALLSALVVGAGLFVTEEWVMPTQQELLWLAGAAGFLIVGFVTIIIAMRSGDISLVAPFRYSIILWAIVIGYVVWGDVPDPITVAGIVVIVAAGIYSLIRERKHQVVVAASS